MISARVQGLAAIAGLTVIGLCVGFDRFAPHDGAIQNQTINVKAFGAKGDGQNDDTQAIYSAIEALPPSGGTVFLPAGTYLTTGLVLADRKVMLVGEGGACDGPPLPNQSQNAATVLLSKTNAPIVKFTVNDRVRGQFQNRFWVGMRDIAVQGNGNGNAQQLNNQHGLQIDNRGLEIYNVSISNCGGHGVYLTDSVVSNLYNLRVYFCNGDGINNDDTPTFAKPGQGSANGTNIFGGSALGNGRDGIRIERNGWGTSTFGFTVEGNAGYGINLLGKNPNGHVRFCRFMSTWDEANRTGSVHFSDLAMDNLVDYVRYGSGKPVRDRSYNRNLVWGSDLSDGGELILSHELKRIITAGGINSSDLDCLDIRDRTGTAGGLVRAGSFASSQGLPASGIYPPGMARRGAFNVPNGRGLFARRKDEKDDYELISSTPADGVNIASQARGPIQFGTALTLSSGAKVLSGSGAPSMDAPIGSLFLRIDGADEKCLYIREPRGWTAK
jgi:hypothetical protein